MNGDQDILKLKLRELVTGTVREDMLDDPATVELTRWQTVVPEEWRLSIGKVLAQNNQVSRRTLFRLGEMARNDCEWRLPFLSLVMMWGYTYDSRPNDRFGHVGSVCGQHRDVAQEAIDCAIRCLDSGKGLRSAAACFRNDKDTRNIIQGLGVSFYSKVLYFLGYDHCTPKPLIFDNQVAKQLIEMTCLCPSVLGLVEISRRESTAAYSAYCELVADCANAIGSEPDVIEYALYNGGRKKVPVAARARSNEEGEA